jgi:hypothetical protein
MTVVQPLNDASVGTRQALSSLALHIAAEYGLAAEIDDTGRSLTVRLHRTLDEDPASWTGATACARPLSGKGGTIGRLLGVVRQYLSGRARTEAGGAEREDALASPALRSLWRRLALSSREDSWS